MMQATRTAWRRLLLPVAAAAMLAGGAAAHAADDDGLEGLVPGSPAAGIYGSNHLAHMPDKAELVFDYRFEGTVMENPFTDDVLLDFTRHVAAGAGEDKEAAKGFDVEMTIFPQTRKITVGPVSARSFNPILLVFFQRDVTHMSNGTGGSQHYFRNVIRAAMQNPEEGRVTDITVELDGRQVAAREISFRPFIGDSHRAQLRGFADKTYRVVVSEAVPGGIYEVQSETPDEKTGEVLLRETYRFREIRQ